MTRAQEEAPPSCVLIASFKKRKGRSTGKLLEAVLHRYLETQASREPLRTTLSKSKCMRAFELEAHLLWPFLAGVGGRVLFYCTISPERETP
jgi:hypothetical protein